jgi:hypothetical protein
MQFRHERPLHLGLSLAKLQAEWSFIQALTSEKAHKLSDKTESSLQNALFQSLASKRRIQSGPKRRSVLNHSWIDPHPSQRIACAIGQ